MTSGQKQKNFKKKFASYTEQQIQSTLSTAIKLSYYYAKKFPDVGFDEFYSISLVAIAEGLITYNKRKGTISSWISHYIYARFHTYLIRKYKKQKKLLEKIHKMSISI